MAPIVLLPYDRVRRRTRRQLGVGRRGVLLWRLSWLLLAAVWLTGMS
jgi:hypothetical protein